MLHAFTVDVEDWYHDGAAEQAAVGRPRVEENTRRVLELMRTHGARGTFFCLGEVAARFPGLIRDIAAAGHEIGSHGYRHVPVPTLTRRQFRADVEYSVRLLEDISGQPVCGYRAPYFSLQVDVHWPLDILAELGLTYDASARVIDRPPGMTLVCPRSPFRHANGLWEVPVAVLPIFGTWHLPLAGGAGLRLLPPRLFYRFLEAFEQDVGAGVFYLHPWELDPDSPTAAHVTRWLLRVGRHHLPRRLSSLLAHRRFASVLDTFQEVRS